MSNFVKLNIKFLKTVASRSLDTAGRTVLITEYVTWCCNGWEHQDLRLRGCMRLPPSCSTFT